MSIHFGALEFQAQERQAEIERELKTRALVKEAKAFRTAQSSVEADPLRRLTSALRRALAGHLGARRAGEGTCPPVGSASPAPPELAMARATPLH